jgi:hypothetical protein
MSGSYPDTQDDDILDMVPFAPENTFYQEQLKDVVRDSARIFRYWIMDSGSTDSPNDTLDSDFISRMTQDVINRQMDSVQNLYNSSPYAFDQHLEIVQSLFHDGLLDGSYLETLLMQSIQTKWKDTGCPWIYDEPTEYNMAVSQIDWIFSVVGAYVGDKSTDILETMYPHRRYYKYLPSLHVLREIVINIIIHKKRVDLRRLIIRMEENQVSLSLYMEGIINAFPIMESTWVFTERDVMKTLETLTIKK